jgi:hypothetical protein
MIHYDEKKKDLNLQLTVTQSQLYDDFVSLKNVSNSVPDKGWKWYS